MPTLTYSRVNRIIINVIINNAIIFINVHNMLNRRDTEVVICIILHVVLSKNGDIGLARPLIYVNNAS